MSKVGRKKKIMYRMLGLIKEMVRKSIEGERAIDSHVENIARLVWPWKESRLLILVSIIAILDYVSTYAFLALSGNNHVYEGGLLASWAIRTNGFRGLILVDILAIAVLVLIATSTRFIYSKFGFKGFGRAAFIFVLTPYVIVTMAVIFNNIVITFL